MHLHSKSRIVHFPRAGIIFQFCISFIVSICFPAKSAVAGAFAATPQPPALTQSAYIWQRAWNAGVQQSVSSRESSFAELVPLAAEISFKHGPTSVSISPKYSAVQHARVGLAVRIGPLNSTDGAAAFEDSSPQTQLILRVCNAALAEAKSAGVKPVELQIDFDCADSKLALYGNWVRAIKAAIAPVSVVITVLPSWLTQRAFKDLAAEAGGFVLQVHSLHRPAGPDVPMVLCDADEALAAVRRASTFGVPFRVALPTYSYTAGFDKSGKLLGLSAEGPAPDWPADAQMRELRADPASIAGVVQQLIASPAPNLAGIIWYRLPTNDDSMNWPWPTLQAVMTGRSPHGNLVFEVRRDGTGLIDIDVTNTGDGDAKVGSIVIDWNSADLIASDASAGFERTDSPAGSVIFQRTANAPARLVAGARWNVGWIRLTQDKEVHAHIQTKP